MDARCLRVLVCALVFLLAMTNLSSCGGGMNPGNSGGTGGGTGGGNPGSPSGSQTPSVTVTVSDPAVCSATQGGPFQHIYVTITDVVAYPSATIPLTGGVDLTPGLAQSPMQIDLLGTAPGGSCTLATLGSGMSVAAGTYQALQIFFADTSALSKISGGTKCPNTFYGVPANCAIHADGTVDFLDLLTSGTPVGLVNGPVTLGNGQQVLNIDLDSCASMLAMQGSGSGNGYAMDPVAHAALMPTSGSITGKVIDGSTQQPIAGPVIVALEQTDSGGVDREIMQVGPGPDGSFVLCPVPSGTFDLVTIAESNVGVAYGATVTTGVQAGNSVGNIPLQPVAGGNQTPSQLAGQVTALALGTVAGYSHIVISALQTVSVSGSNTLITVPLPARYQSSLRTFVTSSMNYQLSVPAANPLVGAFMANRASNYQQDTTNTPTYNVDVQSSCSPAVVRSSSGVTIGSGSISTVPTIALVGCPPA